MLNVFFKQLCVGSVAVQNEIIMLVTRSDLKFVIISFYLILIRSQVLIDFDW